MNDYRPTSFNILPPIVKNLIILNALMALATFVFYAAFDIDLVVKLGLFYVGSDYFHPYQFVTHMFMHAPVWEGNGVGALHILSNMFALWMFGSRLENLWGPKRFLFYYFFCGIGAAIIHSLVTYADINYLASPEAVDMMKNIPTVGASGAVFGVLLAFGMVFPNMVLVLLFPPIPIKAKYFVFFYAIFEFQSGIASFQGGSNIAHFAHLGGMLFGFILLKIWNSQRSNFY